ncbi:ribbon-helix-helix domain-containing protein [Limimaricola cinnabarinus]|jgi:antitoxin ParD1/3/4|uniref:Miscellaneous n=1 Tax=Limimaricola cinnabarinus LL-001 TaxID=1337093 RepID=U2Z684_9RHOB|nr:type II toxin-antitoxin system ParD family antitoxin [Limimaricola cinnabarinus]GAD56582.1 miscellaneous [Limimaricola cinnabarinus LL-001]
MSVKASVSLTEAQDAYARQLVQEGRFPSVSAVIQQGLEMLRKEGQTEAALQSLLAQRQSGPMFGLAEGRRHTEEMIARKRGARDL